MAVKKNHSFHLVDMSPWPILSSFSAFLMVMGMSYWFSTQTYTIFISGMLLTTLSSFCWWRDVSREGSYQGLHTTTVMKGLKMGMVLFITSELFFFLSFFWAFFHNSLSPSMEIGMNWPPLGVMPFSPFQIPLLNTIILLTSGVTITWSHHALIENKMSSSKASLVITLVLGIYFSLLQTIEYMEAMFCISDSAFGSSFFLTTGFHGIHVLIGSLFIMVSLIRMNKALFSKTHHLGFESATWYWHFVDVVWLFLYLNVYWWGS